MRIDVFQSGNPMFIALSLDTHWLRGSGNHIFPRKLSILVGWKTKRCRLYIHSMSRFRWIFISTFSFSLSSFSLRVISLLLLVFFVQQLLWIFSFLFYKEIWRCFWSKNKKIIIKKIDPLLDRLVIFFCSDLTLENLFLIFDV